MAPPVRLCDVALKMLKRGEVQASHRLAPTIRLWSATTCQLPWATTLLQLNDPDLPCCTKKHLNRVLDSSVFSFFKSCGRLEGFCCRFERIGGARMSAGEIFLDEKPQAVFAVCLEVNAFAFRLRQHLAVAFAQRNAQLIGYKIERSRA